MQFNTNKEKRDVEERNRPESMDETAHQPILKKHFVDVMIPPECLDENGGKCEHDHKTEKKYHNPV